MALIIANFFHMCLSVYDVNFLLFYCANHEIKILINIKEHNP